MYKVYEYEINNNEGLAQDMVLGAKTRALKEFMNQNVIYDVVNIKLKQVEDYKPDKIIVKVVIETSELPL